MRASFPIDTKLARFICALGGIVALVFVLLSIGYTVFDNKIVAGPDFVVGAPSAANSDVGVTSVTVTEVDHTVLRVGWNLASVLVLVALMVMAFTAVRVLSDLQTAPLFSADTTQRISNATLAALLLIGIGGVIRFALTSPIRNEVGISAVDGSDSDFALFVFEIPFLVLLLAVQGIGWAWRTAERLQDDIEHVV